MDTRAEGVCAWRSVPGSLEADQCGHPRVLLVRRLRRQDEVVLLLQLQLERVAQLCARNAQTFAC